MSELIKSVGSDETVAMIGDPMSRLSSGMKLHEAFNSAESWWSRLGRKMMIDLKQQQKAKGLGEFISVDPESKNHVPSGIMNGLEWGQLTGRERVSVLLQWHESHVKVPDFTDLKRPDYVNGHGYQEYDENE